MSEAGLVRIRCRRKMPTIKLIVSIASITRPLVKTAGKQKAAAIFAGSFESALRSLITDAQFTTAFLSGATQIALVENCAVRCTHHRIGISLLHKRFRRSCRIIGARNSPGRWIESEVPLLVIPSPPYARGRGYADDQIAAEESADD